MSLLYYADVAWTSWRVKLINNLFFIQLNSTQYSLNIQTQITNKYIESKSKRELKFPIVRPFIYQLTTQVFFSPSHISQSSRQKPVPICNHSS